MDAEACLNDHSFGPNVRGCRGDFDFTLTFERIFLAIVPGSVFVASCLARLVHLWQRPRIVGGVIFQFTKLVIITVYVTLQLALLILLTTKNGLDSNSLSVAASAVSFVAGLFMLALSYAEHSRSPRPSMLLNGYVLLTLLFDIVRTRTSWLVATDFQESLYARLFTSSVAAKVLLLLFEAQRKSRWVRWDAAEHSPEETAGLFGLGVYAWLNRLFASGYRSILSLDNLYPLDSSMMTESLFPKLQRRLESPSYHPGNFSLAKALFRALAVQWLLPVAPRIALIGFKFAQPFFLKSLLEYLQASQAPGGPQENISYGLIGASVLIYVGLATSLALYNYYAQRTLYMTRSCLASAVYKKTMEAKTTAGNDGAALTLMSADVERIVQGFYIIHELWGSLVEFALGCWLLQQHLGSAFAAPIVTIVACGLVAVGISHYSGNIQRAWMSVIQKRVGLTASAIGSMKGLKITGIVSHVSDMIQTLRVEEIKSGNRFRFILIVAAVTSMVPMTLTPVFTFAVTSNTLDITTIYTSMSYLLLLTSPLVGLLQSLPHLVAAFACLTRIQKFLEAEPRIDYRKFVTSRPGTGISGSKSSGTVLSATGDVEMGAMDTKKSMAQTAEKPTELVEPVLAVTITDGSFGWAADKMSLKNIKATIQTGQLTMVVGPVASGKSTFCYALLGEMPYASGQVTLYDSYPEGVGFCEQTPFLLNASLKENIVGFSPFNQVKYEEIIEATRLGLDVDQMPSGHDTKIGSNGIMLSGGQKQRVSLARALYLESKLAIFDDILSGLDNDTQTEVFRRVFGPDGILRRRGTTVVLCTHSIRHLPVADHIIALGSDGTLVEAGSFQDLMQNNMYVQSLGVQDSGAESTKSGSDVVSSEKSTDSSSKQTVKPKSKVLKSKLDNARQLGDWKVYSHYFRNVNRGLMLLVFLVGVCYGFGDNFSTVWMGFWAGDKFSRDNSFYLGIFALLRALQLVWVFFVGLGILISFTTLTGSTLHKEALQTVVTAPLSFFTNTDTGIVTNLFSQDMTLIDSQLPGSFLNMSLIPFGVVGLACVIAIATPYLAAGYPVLFLILYVLQKFYLRTSRQMRLLDLEAKSPLYTNFIDTIKGIASIRAYGWCEKNMLRNNHLLNTSQRPAYLLVMIQQWLALTLQLTVAAIAVILVSLATQLSASAGLAGASLVSLMNFGEMLGRLIVVYTMLETSIGAVARLKTFSEVVRPEDLPGEDFKPPENWPSRGGIEMINVSASYDTEHLDVTESEKAEAQDAPIMAFKNLSLSIQPGEKVAICGRTGSGKSSLFLVLVRLLDPRPECATNITIDDIPLHTIDRATLRQRIIAVPQDPVFLPGGNTIRANLDPLDAAASDEERLAVLRTVQLDSLVEDGEGGGLDAEMKAESLSAGQKQLFSLGRAILRCRVRENKGAQGGILLLDEVSSSVDQDTDRAMQEVIREEFARYTIVMVSHRLEMVMQYFDTVVVLDQGVLVERGEPKVLVEVEGSRFRELWVQGKG